MSLISPSARTSGYQVSLGGRLVVSASSYSAAVATITIVLQLVVVWLLAYHTGGSRTVAPHLFYLPLVLAAVRFGRRGAVLTAIVAGIAAGPFLPLDVDAGTAQQTFNWVMRTGLFTVVGLVIAFFVHHSKGAIGDDLAQVVIRRDLRRALESRHLHVEFQPIIELASGRTIGAEALVRWADPDRGSIPPAEFIPAAEGAGVVELVSDFVLREVTHSLGEWRSSGLLVRDEDFKLAVNISGSELRDDRLEALVRELVVREHIPAKWLHLEVTETALIDDLEVAIHGLQRLRGIGVRLAVDDFGQGESSLRYLHRFPIDTLKIDRSFITPLVDDELGRGIVQSVIDLAHTMGLRTVAEGVETAMHADVLLAMGCDLAQGFHFARPLHPLGFEERLRLEARHGAPVRRRRDEQDR